MLRACLPRARALFLSEDDQENDKTGVLRVPSQTQESGGLAQRYSHALFELADEERALDTVARDLDSL